MRRTTVRFAAVLAAVVSVVFAAGAPAGASTGELSASCEARLRTAGKPEATLTVRGGYRLLGTVPATSPSTAPLTASGWGVSVRLDLDVLGPELAARGVTLFDQVSATAAHLSVHHDGVEDWPQNLGGDIGRGIAVDRFAAGVTGPVSDRQLYPGDALPGQWRFASSGDIRLSFHKFSGVQTQTSVHCTAAPDQDLTWGETVVAG
ncbi:hypothetical protein C8D88_112277 [Lentzea atacamensis]|uniref:Uncharacterized protein n=1 Tax=Lentzea atacamensis TaxID=531938 RepID=A0A316HRG2_9PSEU|nr:hypothetical protein [Lentzea atacamensis]PWK83026.1 hypothetical protein C8D88_112277 [Lentzea atacamensis]